MQRDQIAVNAEAIAVRMQPGGAYWHPVGGVAVAGDAVEPVGRLSAGQFALRLGHGVSPSCDRGTIPRLHGEQHARATGRHAHPAQRPQGAELHGAQRRKRAGLQGGRTVRGRSCPEARMVLSY